MVKGVGIGILIAAGVGLFLFLRNRQASGLQTSTIDLPGEQSEQFKNAILSLEANVQTAFNTLQNRLTTIKVFEGRPSRAASGLSIIQAESALESAKAKLDAFLGNS